jgi:hypothetical protein
MPRLICQFLYVEYHMLATASLQSYQFICQSQYQFLHALCQISHASYSIPAFICRHMSAKSFLWVAKVVYMSISVDVCQTAISQSICQVLYFICYMPNAMGYMPNSICQIAIHQMLWPLLCLLVWLQNRLDISLYMYIYYPAMTLHIAVTEKKLLLYHYGFNLYLRSQVFQFVSISGYQVIS